LRWSTYEFYSSDILNSKPPWKSLEVRGVLNDKHPAVSQFSRRQIRAACDMLRNHHAGSALADPGETLDRRESEIIVIE
jgi:hypothetical protein